MRGFKTFLIGTTLFIVSILPGTMQPGDLPVFLALSYGLPWLWRHGRRRRKPGAPLTALQERQQGLFEGLVKVAVLVLIALVVWAIVGSKP